MKKHAGSISVYSNPDVIAALTAELERHNIAAFDIRAGDGHIAIALHANGYPPHAMPAVPASPPVLAHAPAAGHFLPEHPLRSDSAAKAGTSLAKGQVAGFVKVGPVLVAVISETSGVAGSHCVQPGTLVGFGDPLVKARA